LELVISRECEVQWVRYGEDARILLNCAACIVYLLERSVKGIKEAQKGVKEGVKVAHTRLPSVMIQS